jgi:membrane associated rhomboid family serine protease
MDDSAGPGSWAVGRTPSRQHADRWVLALASQGISSAVASVDNTWIVSVPANDALRARRTIEAFERENAATVEATPREPARVAGPLAGAVISVAALAAFHLFRVSRASPLDLVERGSANARLVLGGAPERAVTAMTLHANAEHVAANVVIGCIFLAGLYSRTGVGVGLALTVYAGAVANLLNAAIQGPPHDGIGFSGAVFAAVGALAGLALCSRERRTRNFLLAFAAALALAALFGTGESTDVLGHFLGFVSGLGVGALFARPALAARWHTRTQLAAGLAAVGLICFAWYLALQ